MTVFPTPQWHELDGGRSIDYADCVIAGEPEEGGWVNIGIYRVQIHNRNTLGLYVSPGHRARIMREKYSEKGKNYPVVVTFGQNHLFFSRGPIDYYGISEFDYCGGLRGAPVDIIRGDVTGFPLQARPKSPLKAKSSADRASSDGRSNRRMARLLRSRRSEGACHPRQKALLRNDPILGGAPPMKPPFHVWRSHRRRCHMELFREGRHPRHQGRLVLRRRICRRRRRAVYYRFCQTTLSRPRATSGNRCPGLPRWKLSWPVCHRRR